jgi:hypothetical protein
MFIEKQELHTMSEAKSTDKEHLPVLGTKSNIQKLKIDLAI